jgi:PAS domain S-box-containing protein
MRNRTYYRGETVKQNTISDERSNMADIEGVSLYDWDMRTGEFMINDYAGVPRPVTEELKLTRRSWESLLHPDDRNRVSETCEHWFKNESPAMEAEYRILTTSGRYKWFMDRAMIVERNERWEPSRVKGILVDISERKRVEEMLENRNKETLEALQKSEDEKRVILQGLRGLANVRYIDPNLRIVWTNADTIQGLDVGNQATSPVYCYTVIRGRTEPCTWDCIIMKALEKGEPQETEDRLGDGQSFISRGNPVKNSAGAVLGVIQIALNVTKHKQTEEGLKTTHEFLHSLLENSPTPIYVSGRDGRIDTVNHAWEEVFGFRRAQAIGRSFNDIFPPEAAGRINCLNERILQSAVPTELEESINCPTGLHHFHTIKFPLQDAAGQTAAVASISVDVTARNHVEQELTKREAELKGKSRQLREMNTALRVLLRQREEDQRELEERIVSNVKELVLPYVRKLKGMHLNEGQMSYLEIVETHLNDIVTPFLRQLVSDYPHMTAKELQVATFVKEGKANKEIADLMNVSVNAIEIHRYKLRKKLSLQNKKINLRSYLLSLNKLPS